MILVLSLNPVIQKTFLLSRMDIGEVNRCDEYYTDAAGKGVNVTRILTQLGERALLVSHAGGREADFYLSLVKQDRIPVRIVDSKSDVRTCYTILESDYHSTTELVEEAKPVSKGTEALVRELYEDELCNAEAVIITGTLAPGYSDNLFPDCVQMAKQKGKKVILDIKGKNLVSCLPFSPDLIKPNLSEFADTFFPDEKVSEQEVSEKIVKLCSDKMKELFMKHSTLTVLTMGRFGVMFFDGEKTGKLSANEIVPVNTIGCGDAFTAGLASAIIRRQSLLDAVTLGQSCAEKNALLLKPGTIIAP